MSTILSQQQKQEILEKAKQLSTDKNIQASIHYHVNSFYSYKKKNPTGTIAEYIERLPTISKPMANKYKEEIVQIYEGLLSTSGPWSCSACTFDNPASAKICSMCGAKKPSLLSTSTTTPSSSTTTTPSTSPSTTTPSTTTTSTTPSTTTTSTTLAPAIKGFCPITNLGNWCFLNSSIQLFNDIPELKNGFGSLTLPAINTSDTIYTERRSEEAVHKTLRIFYTLFETIAATNGTSINFKIPSVILNGVSVYEAFIELVQTSEENKMSEARKPFHITKETNSKGEIKLTVKQSDADEFILRVFEYLFSSDIDFIHTLKYLFTFKESSNIKCVDKRVIESAENLKKTLELNINIINLTTFEERKAKSIQEIIDNNQAIDILKSDSTLLDACGTSERVKGEAISRAFKYTIFPFTKYLFMKLGRSVGNEYYQGTIEVNKKLTIDGVTFQPKGVIHHSGRATASGTSGGHYTYYHFENGEPAILCNDATISKIVTAEERRDAWQRINGDPKEKYGGARALLYERIGHVDVDMAINAVRIERGILEEEKAVYTEIATRSNAAKENSKREKTYFEREYPATRYHRKTSNEFKEILENKSLSNNTRKRIKIITNSTNIINKFTSLTGRLSSKLIEELKKLVPVAAPGPGPVSSNSNSNSNSNNSNNEIQLKPVGTSRDDAILQTLCEIAAKRGIAVNGITKQQQQQQQRITTSAREEADMQAAMMASLAYGAGASRPGSQNTNTLYEGGKRKRRTRKNRISNMQTRRRLNTL